MEFIKPQISLTLNKGEFSQLVAEALADPDSSAAIKRILNPLLSGKFPQFPEFTVVTLGDTDESGATQVLLKQPPVAKSTAPATPATPTPIKSLEPMAMNSDAPAKVLTTTEAPVESTVLPSSDPFDEPIAQLSNEYIEPSN